MKFLERFWFSRLSDESSNFGLSPRLQRSSERYERAGSRMESIICNYTLHPLVQYYLRNSWGWNCKQINEDGPLSGQWTSSQSCLSSNITKLLWSFKGKAWNEQYKRIMIFFLPLALYFPVWLKLELIPNHSFVTLFLSYLVFFLLQVFITSYFYFPSDPCSHFCSVQVFFM